MEWSQHLTNGWFIDASSATDGAKTKWKVAAYRLGHGMTITAEGTTVVPSAQHAEVIAALLTVRQKLRKARGKFVSSPVPGACEKPLTGS